MTGQKGGNGGIKRESCHCWCGMGTGTGVVALVSNTCSQRSQVSLQQQEVKVAEKCGVLWQTPGSVPRHHAWADTQKTIPAYFFWLFYLNEQNHNMSPLGTIHKLFLWHNDWGDVPLIMTCPTQGGPSPALASPASKSNEFSLLWRLHVPMASSKTIVKTNSSQTCSDKKGNRFNIVISEYNSGGTKKCIQISRDVSMY